MVSKIYTEEVKNKKYTIYITFGLTINEYVKIFDSKYMHMTTHQ